MPSHMPTYYKWAKDRPCTTNAEYGYTLQMSHSNDLKSGVQNFNSTSFPGGSSHKQASKSSPEDTSSSSLPASLTKNHPNTKTKPINHGYITGYVPVTQKTAKIKNRHAGANLVSGGAVTQGYEHQSHSAKDTYLWHALSGTLVHCKNSGEI